MAHWPEVLGKQAMTPRRSVVDIRSPGFKTLKDIACQGA